ncbi:MAG: hypothetical protein RIF32_22440 [Leptospirales bacterium]
MIQTSRQHYEGLLADRYSWLYGGFEAKLAENESFLKRHSIVPALPGARAGDLGAGPGFQSIALAAAGFAVDAVDRSPTLLRELERHAEARGIAWAAAGASGSANGPGVAPIRTVEADLVEFLAPQNRLSADSYELLTCMGDTLPHLPSFAAVEAFFEAAQQKLKVGGRLILGFRDLSQTLTGLDRFIPVRSDAERLFTCFLEPESDEHIVVHDLIYEWGAAEGDWQFQKSCYRKLRIGPAWVTERLLRAGFRIAHEDMARGFITLIAERAAKVSYRGG